jgi:hypothetical protein
VAAPTVAEIRELLDLAGKAAHASERTAAPLASWIAGRSELSLAQLCDVAERVGSDLEESEFGTDRAPEQGS